MIVELSKRRVFRVISGYAVVCFVILQIADVAFEPLGIGDKTLRVIIAGMLLALPLVGYLSWVFDVDPGSALTRTKNSRPWLEASIAIFALLGFAVGAWFVVKSPLPNSDGYESSQATTLNAPSHAQEPNPRVIDNENDQTPSVNDLDQRSIAVLPFDDLSTEGNLGWLAAGMADALIDSLGRIDDLRIPGRTSTTNLKNQGASIESIGEQLNVGSVIEGSVHREGDQLNVVARWIRVADEKSLWSARYTDRAFDDVFDVQNEIATTISEALRAEFGIKDSYDFLMQSRYQPSDVRAWEYFRKAYDIFAMFDVSRMPEAAELCQKSIDADPEYAGGYGCLSMAEIALRNPAKAIEMAERALALDPFNGPAHWTIGQVRLSTWQFVKAEEQLKRALAGNPREPNILITYLSLLSSTGRHQEFLKEARQFSQLEPLLPTNRATFARSLVLVGEYEAALVEFEQAKAVGTISSSNPFYIAIAQRRTGNESAAVDTIVELFSGLSAAAIRAAYDRSGWEGMNLYLADNAKTKSCLPTQLGFARQRERMYACLEQQLESQESKLPQVINQRFGFEEYWGEPRFQDILRRLNARIESKDNARL